jgi:hypothetical protein
MVDLHGRGERYERVNGRESSHRNSSTVLARIWRMLMSQDGMRERKSKQCEK